MAYLFGNKYFFSFLIFLPVIYIDQVSKFYLTTTCNPGMAFSLILPLGRFNIVLTFMVLLGALYLFVKQRARLSYAALVLILSGGVSNLIDRIMFGCVRDFIDFGFFVSFNIADSLISVGVITIVILEITGKKKSNDLNH